jgi:hypothetical protein
MYLVCCPLPGYAAYIEHVYIYIIIQENYI